MLQTQNATSTIAFRGQDVQSNKNSETENSETENSETENLEMKKDRESHSEHDEEVQKINKDLSSERIHLIWSSLEGETPDFHQPHHFPPCPDLSNPID